MRTVLAVVSEPLAHGTPREGCEVLKRRSLGRGSRNHDRIFECVILLEGLHKLCNRRSLLADGNVDTVELLIFVLAVVPSLLVEDRVKGDGRLAGLTVTDDELTLATANGHHGVNGLQASLHGLVHGAPGENTGSLKGGATTLRGLDRTLAVDRVSEGIDDTAKELGANGHVHDLARAFHGVTLLDETIVTEDGNTDVVGFQVKTHAANAGGEFHHLLCKTMSHGRMR